MTNVSKFILSAVLLSVSYFAGIAQKQEKIERKQLFDYNWKFNLGDTQAASARSFDDNNWRNLDLPAAESPVTC